MQTAMVDLNDSEDRVHEEGSRASVDLVEQAVRGDRLAFDRLVEPHLVVALGAARLITGNESDAADAVQDALLSSWQALDRLRDPKVFAAWFRRIVIRSATRFVRRRGHLVELNLEIETPDAPDSLEREFDLRQLGRAFGRLDQKDRILLTLHHYWCLPVAESAQILGLPEGTVRSRVHHALRRLRAGYDAEVRL
jgi:RNA polymerase sigma-70 factor (ECF subfamily)